MDGEIGRFSFVTHQLVQDGNTLYDTAKDFFRPLMSREWYRTEGFNEIALNFVSALSYRGSAQKFNRIRWQVEGGTPSRTLAHITEVEGHNAYKNIEETSSKILEENSFTTEGKPVDNISILRPSKANMALSPETITEALSNYNKDRDKSQLIDENAALGFYENPKTVVNISIDDVGVKKQKETGRSTAKADKGCKEYVHNTVAHIENGGKRYILNAVNTLAMIPLLIAFLIHNQLLGYPITFFVDGARSLHSALLEGFSWLKSFSIILDWYHLKKKCEYELSLVLKGSKHRNSVLEELLPVLWLGKINDAIAILRNLSPEIIKPGQSVERLIGYYERNKELIPCYALRKKLGLRISSNKGEKANDLVVSDRQKHNGMSWSKDGSAALATVKSLEINNELNNWISNGQVDFKLSA